jgi:hypothetical protein
MARDEPPGRESPSTRVPPVNSADGRISGAIVVGDEVDSKRAG